VKRQQRVEENKTSPFLERLDLMGQRLRQEKSDRIYAARLRRLSSEFPDPHQRLEAIADEVCRRGRPPCPRMDRIRGPYSVKDLLGWGRGELIVKPACKPIEWHEAREGERVDLEFSVAIPPSLARAYAESALPFAELEDEGRRRACLEKLGGELPVRKALERFHREFGLSRDWLSLHLARMEWSERKRRRSDQQDELWDLLKGVRELDNTARSLGCPKDVLACMDAWHYRVLAVVMTEDRAPWQYRHEMRQGLPPVESKGRRATRVRYLRRGAERALVKQLGPEDVAVLETAWLLPVKVDSEGETILLEVKDAQEERAEFPVRPELNDDLSPEANAREAHRFYIDLAKELRSGHKQLSRPRRTEHR